MGTNMQDIQFLSTLSLRRATAPQQENGQAATISIHALLAESDNDGTTKAQDEYISIHALLAESDGGPGGKNTIIFHFYPRSPCGERRLSYYFRKYLFLISIHALLAESDPSVIKNRTAFSVFLSTLSLRRATHNAGP